MVETSSSMAGSGSRQMGSPKAWSNAACILSARIFKVFMIIYL
jgi:hypothetical protein